MCLHKIDYRTDSSRSTIGMIVFTLSIFRIAFRNFSKVRVKLIALNTITA